MFAKNGWLVDLTKTYIASDPSYDASDLLPAVAKSLSYKGDLYSAPFYGESSMLYYNKTLLSGGGHHDAAHPTWTQVAAAAAKLNQPGTVAGICLRGLAGWGDNMASLDTVINTFGGEWYDKQLAGPARLARRHGRDQLLRQPDQELRRVRRLQRQLQPAADPVRPGQVRDVVRRHGGGDLDRDHLPVGLRADRLRVRAGRQDHVLRLALVLVARHPAGRDDQSAAWKWISWATSKQYDTPGRAEVRLVGGAPGHRASLYSNPNYLKAAAPFANITLQSIDGTDPDHPTVNPVPYVGVQYVDIPQFETLGMSVGQQIAGAIAGTESVSQAISAAQSDASAYTPAELSGTN